MTQLQKDNNVLKEQIATLGNAYLSKIAGLTMLTNCCLSRLHQVLISIVPYIEMSVGEHHEILQLIYELLRMIHLLKSNANIESYV